MNETRILQEIAIYADKVDFSEEVVRLRSRGEAGAYRLLYPYSREDEEKKNSLFIYHPDGGNLGGKLLFIQDKAGENAEYFTVSSQEDEEECHLFSPLSADYEKMGTVILPVFEAKADAFGTFFFPIPFALSGEREWVLREGEAERGITISPGERNVI